MTTKLIQYARRLPPWLRKMPHAETIGASCLLVMLLAIFFWRALFLGETLLPNDLIYELDPVWQSHAPKGFTAPGNRLLSDVTYFFYPWQVEMQRSLSERRLPLWTPRINNGQPMLGNGQVGMWDPFWVVGRLFPLPTSFLVTAFLKLWVGGLFTFLLARRLGVSRRGAVLAMITFAFSGPMIVWLGYTVTGVAAWLPMLLYLSERALTKQTTAPFLAVALVIACQFLSGHPETSFHVLSVWSAFCLARVVAQEGWRVPRLAQLLGKMSLAVGIGFALSAVQLLPLAEGILNSAILIRRQAGAPTSLLRTILFEWRHWPTLTTTILPNFFGTPVDGSYWYPHQNYNEQTFYAGIIPLALGLMTLLAWRHERRHSTLTSVAFPLSAGSWRGFWFGLTLLALGIAAQLPLFNVVDVVPILRLVNQGRLRIVYVLGTALLAGYGLDILLQTRLASFHAPRKLLMVLGALAMVSLVLTGGAYAGVTVLRDQFIATGRRQAEAMKATDHPMFSHSLDYYYERVNLRYMQTQRLYTLNTPEMFFPVGVALAAGFLEWMRRRGWNQAIWLNGLIVLACADLFVFGIRVNPTIPEAWSFPPTQATEFLKKPGIFRASGLYLALMPNSGMVLGLSDARGFDDVVPWRQAKLLQSMEGAIRLNHYALLRSANSRLLDLMNVEYMITDRELSGRWKLAFAETDSPIRVYHNASVLPRAFIVYQFEHAASADRALNRLLDETFDFRERVILEGMSPGMLEASGTALQAGPARIVQYEPERVVVESDTPADGILVLTDTYAPGWRARVDGQPAEVYIADFAFRAVRVPAGHHRVEFVYAPASFAAGSALSVAALACCGLWAAVILYQRMR